MTPQEQKQVIEVIKRINLIEGTPQDEHLGSCLTLAVEYLRRISLWINTLNCYDKYPFFDLPARIDPTLKDNSFLIKAVKNKKNLGIHAQSG